MSALPMIGGNSSIDFSKTERAVGTWIDGKTLYQITIETNMPTISSDQQRAYRYVTFPELSSIDKIVEYSAICMYGTPTTYSSIPQYWDSDNKYYALRCNIDKTNGIYLFVNRLTASNATVYVTVWYTKTTS